MNSSLTIRLDKKHREALRNRARTEAKSESEVVRDLIEQMDAPPKVDWAKLKRLQKPRGLSTARLTGWATVIREHNWRT